jgi:FkbM family methyltransferase
VEPNKQNLTYITNWAWASKVQTVETGLSQSGGKQILYVTNVDSGSSLLEPVVNENMKHRVGDLSYFFPVTKKEINTITLQNVIDMHNIQPNIPIGIKLDTQGTEFSILQGLDSKIFKENVICVEIENTLLAKPFMKGSAKFQNVLAFFEENEFELVAFNPIKCNSPLVNTKLNSSSVLNECDAVFLLRHDIIKKRPLEFQTTMLGYYVSYKLYGEAFELLKYITLNNKSNPALCKSCNLLMEHFH